MPLLSVDFFVLLPIALLVYHLTHARWRRHCLLAISYLFYCTWSVAYAALLLASTILVYTIGRRIENASAESTKKRYLTLGILCLIAVLAGFKYAPAASVHLADIAAPLGISYYTFKLVSYLVDVYWEKLPAERDVFAFALYPAFFPQIVCGPIQRARDFLSQVDGPRRISPAMLGSGLRNILFGLFKKLVIADRLAFLVNRVFDHPREFSSPALVIASYAFAIQLYADFSGLSDIAIGIGRLFGIESPPNFDAPFYAPNIQEFWRRWHMTLTSWLTDYLFTPLRIVLRNRGNAGLVIAIVVNMVVLGAWHGPRWTYVVFGLINALYMVGSALTMKARTRFLKRMPRLAAAHQVTGPLVTFHLVVLAFVVLRANCVPDAAYILTHMLPIGGRVSLVESVHGLGFSFDHIYWAVLAIPVMEALQLAHRSHRLDPLFGAQMRWVRWPAYYAGTLVILLFGVLEVREFIYAHF